MPSHTGTIKLFDKSDIYFCTDLDEEVSFTEILNNHTLMYVYSGELVIRENENVSVIGPHECIFLRKGSAVISLTHPKNGEDFQAAYIRLKRHVLEEFFKRLDHKERFIDHTIIHENTFSVRCNPDIKSLFYSMIPYSRENISPTPVMTDLKLQACIFSLLNLYEGFYAILFDFRERWHFAWELFSFTN